MRPLLLSHADVVSNLQSPALLEDLRHAFVTHAATTPRALPDGRGWLEGIPASTERVLGGLPETGGRDVVLLRGEPAGQLLAVIELAHLERVTRAVVGALAVDALSRPQARHVAILGAGPEAARQLKLLRLVRSLDSLRVWDEDLARAHALATRLHQEMGLSAAASSTLEDALHRAEVVLCCDDAAPRHLDVGLLRPGAHVNLLAGLQPREEAGALEHLSRVHEDLDVASAPSAPAPSAGATTLGDVLGAEGSPFPDDARTVFVGGGSHFQDLVAAWQLYQLLRDDPDVGRLQSEA